MQRTRQKQNRRKNRRKHRPHDLTHVRVEWFESDGFGDDNRHRTKLACIAVIV